MPNKKRCRASRPRRQFEAHQTEVQKDRSVCRAWNLAETSPEEQKCRGASKDSKETLVYRWI